MKKKNTPDTPVITGKPINEITQLDIIVSAFQKLDEEQKSRAMRYLTDRFSKYVPSPNY